jgi:hypothetical protein
MESYGKVAIAITAKQLADVVAAVQPKVCAGFAMRMKTTSAWTFSSPGHWTKHWKKSESRCNSRTAKRKRPITGSSSARKRAWQDLQAEVWQKWITAGRSVPDVVRQMVDASFEFLGIKVKLARVKATQKIAKERPRVRRVA